jgi:antitoxin component YwqK of YwqJK toxin-antitoxin module
MINKTNYFLIDAYWFFDKEQHFCPRLNKGSFYKLTGFDFGWFIYESISKFIENREKEVIKGRSLSFSQKTLYYWWYLDEQVANGGFVQFYYNGYDVYIPAILNGLKHIGDHKMVELIEKAQIIYQENKEIVDQARERNLFGSDLYENLTELSDLDSLYYDLNDQTMYAIEKHIRNNPMDVGVDENGNAFDVTYSGSYITYFPNNQPKEIFTLQNGILNGEFKEYTDTGIIKEKIQYLQGKETGEREEYFQNGNLKYKVEKIKELDQFRHQYFFESGNLKEILHKHVHKNERAGEYKEWYENGQLAVAGSYSHDQKRDGTWQEFYENGSKKVEATFDDGVFFVHNHWNEKGEQLLKNGTGLYVYEYCMFNKKVERNEHEYKNYKRHGVQRTFVDGVLTNESIIREEE